MSRRRPVAKAPTPPLKSWVGRHPGAVLWTLVGAAIAIRVTYFVQLNSTPVVEMHRWRQTDMHYYDAWARQIAAGDWMSASVQVPMHRWHREIAAQYLAAHPGDRAAVERESARSNTSPEELIWSRWMHLPRFYQDPLYPYLVGMTYRLMGPDVRWVYAWQAALGVLTVVLIWHLTRQYFGDAAAAWAGGLAVLCGPLTFYEMMLLRDSTIVFAGFALVWLADRAFRGGGSIRFGALGLALGASFLLKSTFLLLATGMTAALIVMFRSRRRDMLQLGMPLVAGFIVALTPLIARNRVLNIPVLSTASSGPMTFVASNEPNYLAEVGFGINTPVLTRFLGATLGGWSAAVSEALRSHTVASYASLLWQKWRRIWHWYEIPNNENFYYLRLLVPVLGWLPVTFWVCAPLALVGLVVAARRAREVWPLYMLVAFSIAPMMIFYVLARFRIALVAAAIPFAALTLVHTIQWIHLRRATRVLGVAVAALVIAAWTGGPLGRHQLLIRMSDWILPYSVYYQSRVYDALDARDWNRAATWYLEFFRYEPSVHQMLASQDASLAPELADMHLECAKILRMSGQASLADAQEEQAQRILRLRDLR